MEGIDLQAWVAQQRKLLEEAGILPKEDDTDVE